MHKARIDYEILCSCMYMLYISTCTCYYIHTTCMLCCTYMSYSNVVHACYNYIPSGDSAVNNSADIYIAQMYILCKSVA